MSNLASRRVGNNNIRIQIPATPQGKVPPTAGTAWTQHTMPVFHISGPPQTGAANMAQQNPYYNPFFNVNSGKASDFMFKQFAGFKDFTKSGLSVGEKSAFWLFSKIRRLSKKWFTHIFLFACLVSYSAIGALVFIACEYQADEQQRLGLHTIRYQFAEDLRKLSKNPNAIMNDSEWRSSISSKLTGYEESYLEWVKQQDPNLMKFAKTINPWTFWNSMFFAGTVYTTIDIGSKLVPFKFGDDLVDLRSWMSIVVLPLLPLGSFVFLKFSKLMDQPEDEPVKPLIIPKIKAESETQTTSSLIQSFDVEMDTSDFSNLRKRRNLSKNRSQAARHREKTPEPSRKYIPHEDTTTSDEEEPRTPKSHREIEADNTYEETKRKLLEKAGEKDEDDIDYDEIMESRLMVENERRRRSISPFALPEKDDAVQSERKLSFVDPNNKLLSTSYLLSPKDEDPCRRNSLTIDTENVRKNSLTSLGSSTGSPREKIGFVFPGTPTTKVQKEIFYADEIKLNDSFHVKQPKSPIKNEQKSLLVETERDTKSKSPVPTSPLQQDKHQETPTGEIRTRVIQVERTPSKKLSDESKQEIRQRVIRTPSKKGMKVAEMAQQAAKSVKESHEIKPPPIKPARSRSASRLGGRTSESEMSEDLNNRRETPSRTKRRKVIPTPRRFLRNRSPRPKRSQSATRADDVDYNISNDKTGNNLMNFLQRARGRSLSISKSETDEEIKKHYKHLRTPSRSPSSRLSCPKTIQIINKKELLESFIRSQKKLNELVYSRQSSGYIEASQSEMTSSCYSSSPSENEYEFDLSKRSAELQMKLQELEDPKHQGVLRKRNRKNKSEDPSKVIVDKSIETKRNSKYEKEQIKPPPGMGRIRRFIHNWGQFKRINIIYYESIKKQRNRCLADIVLLIIICGLGGIMFKTLEGSLESAYKCSSRSVKRDFIEHLWRGSHYLREEDWKSMARNKLFEFENQLHSAHEAGVTSNSGQRSWNFMNSFVYCLTVITTIGYGHIAPSTFYGQLATIVYAVIGIPLFLIVLADFGKLLTRMIKFFWAFVRRCYYTGSCKKVRRTVPMQEMMKGLNIVYDAVRRPSQVQLDGDPSQLNISAPDLPPKLNENEPPPLPPKGVDCHEDEPVTPAISTFEIDDEFNLPISVAIFILICYILCGALLYSIWEDWTFFQSFYFVFISMSTIGFGDFVPKHPMFMMASIIYLVFGLALTSMCINVVQVKLTDSFRQASAKIGATIGLTLSEEDGSLVAVTPTAGEVAPVHGLNAQQGDSEPK